MSAEPPIPLSPCPFCGPGNSCVQCYENDAGRFQVGCGACGSHSGSHKIDKYAIASWNTRAHPTPDRSVVVREALEFAARPVVLATNDGPNLEGMTRHISLSQQKAIAAMGDASTRKDEDFGVPPGRPTSPANTSEISVISDQEMYGIEANWDESTPQEKLAWFNGMARRSCPPMQYWREILELANLFATPEAGVGIAGDMYRVVK